MLAGVRSVSKDILLVGSSAAGEITSEGPASGSVVVMALTADEISFKAAVANNVKGDPLATGKKMASDLHEALGDDMRTLMMFVDVIAGNGSAVVRGVLEVLGKNFPLVGGGSGHKRKILADRKSTRLNSSHPIISYAV